MQPGDVVQFDPFNPLEDNPLPGYMIRGEWIERVLAKGPCRVEYVHPQLKIDGQVVLWKPLTAEVPEKFDLQVPAGHVLIAPPVVIGPLVGGVPQQRATNLDVFTRLAIVPERRVIGRVFWRTWPWPRWGAIE